ncbi:sodium/calcium exchanger 2a isoform X1 [Lates japonicus]|uniref:Sodium/calcium exchanger 2a isoform X1 n=1 Tax=Lates japonicus TaxID=270547 RepID=A0AAD3M450_LATJO|nr:sodium/calcium exchanger 2a isoform X1 [Lates japonicus]
MDGRLIRSLSRIALENSSKVMAVCADRQWSIAKDLKEKHPDKDLDQLIEMAFCLVQPEKEGRAFYIVQKRPRAMIDAEDRHFFVVFTSRLEEGGDEGQELPQGGASGAAGCPHHYSDVVCSATFGQPGAQVMRAQARWPVTVVRTRQRLFLASLEIAVPGGWAEEWRPIQ